MELAITGISATRPKSRPTKFPWNITPIGNTEEKNSALSNNFGAKWKEWAENRISENEHEFRKIRRSKQNSEERQARLAQVGCLSRKGDFDQRRHGWGQAGNKPSFFECGNTGRFNAQLPIGEKRGKDRPLLARYPRLKGVKKEIKAELHKRKGRQLGFFLRDNWKRPNSWRNIGKPSKCCG